MHSVTTVLQTPGPWTFPECLVTQGTCLSRTDFPTAEGVESPGKSVGSQQELSSDHPLRAVVVLRRTEMRHEGMIYLDFQDTWFTLASGHGEATGLGSTQR